MNNVQLDELIPIYAQNKQELDSYKKLCDKQNSEIKRIMEDNGYDAYSTEHYTAKLSVQHRQTMNEDKLLDVIKSIGRDDLIKTREYVDTDLLERAIYNGEIQAEAFKECVTIKDIPTLKISIK